MFAIIEDSGRQFKVAPGEEIAVDLREGLEEGKEIKFDRVLLANGGADSVIGKPAIDGASVSGSVIDPYFKAEKLEIQKFRRRKNSRRHTGHRQKYAIVKIGDFDVPGLEIVEQPQQESAPADEQPEAVTAEATPVESNETEDKTSEE